MKVFVAVPAYDRKLVINTALALLDERLLLDRAGVETTIEIIPGASVITEGRNELFRRFLLSDCDKLVFVDADVSWDLGAMARLITHPVDVVGGAYRFKMDEESYPVSWLPTEELWADPNTGLIEVAAMPTGFLAITRHVVQLLKDAHPERAYGHFGHDLHAWFAVPYGGSEDGAFCADWRAHGGTIWLDPNLRVHHHDGPNTYRGDIGAWLRARMTPELQTAA